MCVFVDHYTRLLPRIMSRILEPFFTVQSNWDECLSELSSKFWVGRKLNGEKSQFFDIVVNDGTVQSTSHELDVTLKIQNVLQVTCSNTDYGCTFFPASTIFSNVHAKNINAVDVSTGGLGATVGEDGEVIVWDSSGSILRKLQGHIMDAYACRFFPSGLVLLTAGSDMTAKIWSLDSGACVQTLKGHRKAVTGVGIVEKGRNVVTCSKDGTVKLWDCGSGVCLTTITGLDGSCINNVAVEEVETGITPSSDSITASCDEKEVGTENKMILSASEAGLLSGYCLRSRTQIFSFKTPKVPINCCCFLDNKTAACGTEGGSIYCFDLRTPSTPINELLTQRGSILSLRQFRSGFLASSSDGTCFYKSVFPINDTCLELTGPDLEPVYNTAVNLNDVYTVCRDRCIRVYRLPSEL